MHILKNTIEVKAFQKGSRQQKFAQKGAVLKQKNPNPKLDGKCTLRLRPSAKSIKIGGKLTCWTCCVTLQRSRHISIALI